MYVCICNAITDRQIKTAVEEGHRTFDQVQQQLNVATCCGQCESHAKEVILEAKSDNGKARRNGSPVVFHPTAGLASF